MATGMLLDFNGLDQKRYDRVNELLSIYDDAPKGMILHSAGPIPNGWRVFDIWESRERFEEFFRQRLQNALRDAGVTEQPTRQEFFPIYNTFAPQASLLTRLTTTAAR